MLVVVTGAGGHVGTNLTRALLQQGRAVRVIDLVEPGHLTCLGAAWVRADVRDLAAMRAALVDAEVVFHLAAAISVTGPMAGRVVSVNVGGVTATARAALDVGVRRFVHCSSVHAFDLMACRGLVVSESSRRSTAPDLPAYDRSKAAGEVALREVIADGLDAVVLNPTGIIGPADPQPSRMGSVLLAAARGRLPATVSGSFDWVDVRDVVAALLAAETAGATGANYLVGGRSAGLDVLSAVAAECAGVRPPRADLPMALARILSPVAEFVGRRRAKPLLFTAESLHALASRPTVDHRLAERDLGHHPRPLEDTVQDLIRFFANEGQLTVRPPTTRPRG